MNIIDYILNALASMLERAAKAVRPAGGGGPGGPKTPV